MAAAAAGRSLAGKPGRLKWTDKMNHDLLECKEKALSLKSSCNPPCYQNGRKKVYKIYGKTWDTRIWGYQLRIFATTQQR